MVETKKRMQEMNNKFVICIPVYKDWDSINQLIPQIDLAIEKFRGQFAFEFLLVDDGGLERNAIHFRSLSKAIHSIRILRLRQNLGHQRAIAVGLCHLHAKGKFEAVVVMDGDGEDSPEGVVMLIDQFLKQNGDFCVFAKRQRRTESFLFKFFYQIYRILHRTLTGHRIEVGNFSILSSDHVSCLVSRGELWNHYAACVVKLKLSRQLIPIDRKKRLMGKSKMNFVSFVIHGISAISVYLEEVGVRLLVFCFGLLVLFIVGLFSMMGINFMTDMMIPGWLINALGLTLFFISQLFIISFFVVIATLNARSSAGFIPLRDFTYFILREEETKV